MAFTVTVDDIRVGQADISWPVIPGAAEWYIYFCDVALCSPSRFVRFGAGTNSTTLSGLPGGFYRYRVDVVDSIGNPIDSSDVFEITYTAGDIPVGWRYYAGEAYSEVLVAGFDDISLTPAWALRIAPNGSNPLLNPFVSIRAVQLSSSTSGEGAVCTILSSSWQWEVYYRQDTGGAAIGPEILAGIADTGGNGCGGFRTPVDAYGTVYELLATFRSNYTDPETGIVIQDSGELIISIDGNPLVTVSDWNHNLNNGLISAGWGINRAIRTIYINGINTNPTTPFDPDLILYQDWDTTFVPAGSITTGLIWYDPTFGNVGGGQIGTQVNSEIIPFGGPSNPFPGAYSAYMGVGIGTVLPLRVVEDPDPPPGEPGTLIITKVVSPANPTPDFNMTVGGGLTPSGITLSNGESVTYEDVDPGTYSVVEDAATGYTTSYSVSNGSPNTAITVDEGEIVIVTVINTLQAVAPNTLSGIYKIVPQKRNDTLWNSLADYTTRDVKKPNPFIKTGYLGE